MELESKGGERGGGSSLSQGVNPAYADHSFRKQEKLTVSLSASESGLGTGTLRHWLGRREREKGEKTAPLMGEGMG